MSSGRASDGSSPGKKTSSPKPGDAGGGKKKDEAVMSCDMTEQNKPVNDLIRAEAEKELKRKNVFSKTFHKVAEKVGLAERTNISEMLAHEASSVEKYRNIIQNLYESMVVMVQPYKDQTKSNAIDSPTLKLKFALCGYKPHLKGNSDKKQAIEIVENMLKNMEERDKEMWNDEEKAMERIRGYVTTERDAQTEQMTTMDDACLDMDQSRQAVKHAKTNEELEKKGCMYQMAIQTFDENAQNLHQSYTDLPYVKRLHQYDFISFLRIYENRFTANYNTVSQASDELRKNKSIA
ncbi:hypothetical protein PFISCL1PPCAC_9872 [Pristionchus fissidentatus]|uniref:BAR domain-containing protein n=1 Tax=Pristionchus fissidentatus TaxID=1538716 RepID=A0AAV5VFW8_9BILA|nr:hypothetical protein PFISCL1PPCAC_9872 [Pristionchus fissidentatus]